MGRSSKKQAPKNRVARQTLYASFAAEEEHIKVGHEQHQHRYTPGTAAQAQANCTLHNPIYST